MASGITADCRSQPLGDVLWSGSLNQDGLESAKPDLQSMFKKPGDELADRRLRVAVPDGRAE